VATAAFGLGLLLAALAAMLAARIEVQRSAQIALGYPAMRCGLFAGRAFTSVDTRVRGPDDVASWMIPDDRHPRVRRERLR